jgi:hypothetical protein
VPKRMKSHLRQLEHPHGVRLNPGEAVGRPRAHIRPGKYQIIASGLAHAKREALLLLPAPMIARLGDD